MTQSSRICTKCKIYHIENCNTCFGFGLTPQGKIISASEAINSFNFLPYNTLQSIPCPECHSTHLGYPTLTNSNIS